MLLKPAPDTPLTALAVAALLTAAGLPDGLLNVLPTDRAPEVVTAWLDDERVRKFSFTGSTATGKLLLEQAAQHVVNVTMELGGNAGWRWSLASSAVIAAVCVALRGGMPESARWLLSKGRREEAEVLIAKYGIEIDVAAELDERAQGQGQRDGFRALFSRLHLRSTLFASVFWAALVLPYFAIGTFWTQVFEALHMGDNAAAALLVYSFTAVAGVTAGCLVVDRIGRRKLLIPPFWITAVCLALVALWPSATPVIVVGFLFFIFRNAASSALTAVYPLEVFPTSLRTTGVGFATAMSRVGAAVGTFLLPMA